MRTQKTELTNNEKFKRECIKKLSLKVRRKMTETKKIKGKVTIERKKNVNINKKRKEIRRKRKKNIRLE